MAQDIKTSMAKKGFPGVTASVLLGLGLGMERGELGRWMTIGIGVMFALYCGGLWLLIEVVGLD